MKTLIINGSPKGNRGNTEIFIRQFLLGAGQDYPVHYAVKESAHELAQTAGTFDTVLIFMPLYVHAMPGIVMKLFEQIKPAKPGHKIGFVIQAGFIERAQTRFLVRYLNAFAKRLGYKNLGIVTRGDAAGTNMVPAFMTKKLFKLLNKLGAHYAQQHHFDSDTTAALAGIYEIPPRKARFYEFLNRTGINHVFWHKFWRDNGVFEKGLDRPFILENKTEK